MGEATPRSRRVVTNLAGLIPVSRCQTSQLRAGHEVGLLPVGHQHRGRALSRSFRANRSTDFLDRRLFGPLGMKDTAFYLTEQQLPRLAVRTAANEQGSARAVADFILYGKSPTSRDRYPAANGGLFSTAADYARSAS